MGARKISLLKFFSIGLVVSLFFLLFGPAGVYHSQPFSVDTIFILEKGESTQKIAYKLEQANLIPHKIIFFIAGLLNRTLNKLKPGEYLIPAHANPNQIIQILASGKGIVHKLTIPEGLTVHEICELVKSVPLLKGELTHIPSEGLLLPETYIYTYGETRQDLINRMETAMRTTLDTLWQNCASFLPLTTKMQLLTLASIIEKETALSLERPRVAAVFINRLKQNIPLQSDPTVIYGLTQGRHKLDRSLRRVDLLEKTDFNTYVIVGLPPHPIACPGKKSLEAAAQPGQFNDLYFVADGTGGHVFSKSLKDHNYNVRRWRRLQKERTE